MRFCLLVAAALLGAVLAPGSAAAYQGGSLKNHSHSTTAGSGGSTLSPTTIAVSTLTSSGSIRQNGGYLKISSGAFIVDGTGASVSINGASPIASNSTTTWSGGNVHLSSTTEAKGLFLGPSTGNGLQIVSDITQGAVYLNALSVDGAAVSSGSVVVINYAGTGGSEYATFTTTTTSAAGVMQGVTVTACPVNTVCPIIIIGIARVKCINGLTVGYHMATHTTRAVATHLSAVQVAATGSYLMTQSSGGDGWCLVWLGPH